MKSHILISLKILLAFTLITGFIYPLFITGVAQIFFPHKANGSLIKINGVITGSELIGQKFDSNAYFCSRPSANNYNPLPSGGSNYGPTNSKLKKQVLERKAAFISANMLKDTINIPPEMLFASASGLDPHISPRAALLQVNRIAKVRKLNGAQKTQLVNLIRETTEKPQMGIFGEERVNVLLLNLELDRI